MKLILLGLGGAAGTILRYLLSAVPAERILGEAGRWFPLGTFAANFLGSMLLVIVALAFGDRCVPGTDVPVALVLGTGFMGGFTTYSTFNLESLRLLESGQPARAALYVAVTLLACFAGAGVASMLMRR